MKITLADIGAQRPTTQQQQQQQQQQLHLSVSSWDSSINPKCSPRCCLQAAAGGSPSAGAGVAAEPRELDDDYAVLRELGAGTYGRVVLARCRRTDTEVALKVLPKAGVKRRDFLREFTYSYYLSPHRHVVNTFDVAFETPTAWVFAQEHAAAGDLFERIVPRRGLAETTAKTVAAQVGSALEFMHGRGLVHRDVKPENVLLFVDDRPPSNSASSSTTTMTTTISSSSLTNLRVKLTDFGMTKRAGTLVRKVSHGIPYTPPEIVEAARDDQYSVASSADVWAFGVLVFCTLTGNFPWELADRQTDAYFAEFVGWQRRWPRRATVGGVVVGRGGVGDDRPAQWRRFTSRLMRLFRRLLDPKPDRRCAMKEVYKYLDEPWLLQPSPDAATTTMSAVGECEETKATVTEDLADATGKTADDVYVIEAHGDVKEPKKAPEMDALLERHGVDTKVDRKLREKRTTDWILSQFDKS